MNTSVSLSTRILIVIIGFGLIAGFMFAMVAVEKRIAAEKELSQLEIKSRNVYFQKQTKLMITEVMSSNSLTIFDGFGLSSDWIEFYNAGDEVISLKDAGLSTNIDDPMMWVFPDFEIGPKEYKIVYASGLGEEDSYGNLHLNFKLNAKLGETLYFTSALGTLLSTIELPPLDSDISYGMNEAGEWVYYSQPTPNEKNGTGGQHTAEKQSPLMITEVMSSNTSTIFDGYGFSSDWIEFYNAGDEVINLRDAKLSTDKDDPMMWVFPEFEIAPQEYKVVYASGLNGVDNAGNLHLNFKLNAAQGETLYFTSEQGTLIASIELPPLDSDISYGLNEAGEWRYYNYPTPNEKNGTGGQESPDFKVYIESPLTITEYMINNRSVLYDEDGDFVDWVEFYNDSDEPFSLAQLYFSDDKTDLRKWAFPNIVIEPRSYLVIYASGKDKVTDNVHTNFRLSEYETLVVSNQYSEVLVELSIEALLADISRGTRGEDWFYFSEPTPGKENSTHGFKEQLKPSSDAGGVTINEVMARNASLLANAYGSYYDWIELKNNTDQDINLKGYSLSKGLEQDTKYVFGDYIVPAQGYAVFFADEEVHVSGTSNYVPFSISASGETLYLCDVDCDQLQIFETGFLGKNASSGLNENGERVFFEIPTPGGSNSPLYAKRYTAPVEFSLNGGEISGDQLLMLTSEEGAEIHFTLDGSVPTSSDTLYANPIALSASRTVRAIAITDGQLPSIVTTQTYIVGVEHDLPIVALSTEPEYLFGTAGMYTNPFNEIERPVHVEFYETDGLALSFDAGFEIAGGYSQALTQKSFAFHLRKDYGTGEINYPLFDENEVTSFKHFLLRTSGQDQYMTKIRDAFIHRVVKDVIDIEVMDSRPCVVYLNGQYWGVYNIREKVNEDYLASHHGVDPDQVDILVYNGDVMAGSDEAYRALFKFVATHDMQDQENYEYVASQIDIDNFIDYLIIQSYFGNTDSGNIKYWRDQNGGKWRWILYDMDWALFKGTHTWNNIRQIFNSNGMGAFDWIDTTLHVNLMKNDDFKREFIERYALYTRTYFSPERLLPIFDAMIAEIESEMPRQEARWPNNWGPWVDHVAFVRQIIIEKPEIEKKNLQTFFNLSEEAMQELFPDES